MTDQASFDRRLSAALLAYVADAPTAVDAPLLATRIAAAHPRRSSALPRFGELFRLRLSGAALILVAALLLLALLVAVLGSGFPRRQAIVAPTESPAGPTTTLGPPTAAALPAPGTPLQAGATYSSGSFTEPFHFVMPVMDLGGGVWDTGTDRAFGLGTVFWNAYFVDDLPVQNNICDPSEGTLPDIPAPGDVGDWLRRGGLKVAGPVEVPVDGRVALRYDVDGTDTRIDGSPCQEGSVIWRGDPGQDPSPHAAFGFAYYAIPTADDTILFIVWSDAGSLPSTRAAADQLVRSVMFDPSPTSLPAELHGRWEAASYQVDFRTASLVNGQDGGPLDEFGRSIHITRADGHDHAFTVRIAGQCGDGEYTVVREPVDQLRFYATTDACVDREAILTHAPWVFASPFVEPSLGPFVAGETYESGNFTEPFSFQMPAVDGTGENDGLPEQFESAISYVSDGGLRFGGIWWNMFILDDLPLNSDLCVESSELLADVPLTPEAVRAWLDASTGLVVEAPVSVPVDGRTALRFDLNADSCGAGRIPAGGYFSYLMRAYAIPTGDDTILLIVGSDGVNWEAVQNAVDALVRSMDFL